MKTVHAHKAWTVFTFYFFVFHISSFIMANKQQRGNKESKKPKKDKEKKKPA